MVKITKAVLEKKKIGPKYGKDTAAILAKFEHMEEAALFFIALSLWFVANTLLQKPGQAWAGLGLLALGVPVYYYWERRHSHPSS